MTRSMVVLLFALCCLLHVALSSHHKALLLVDDASIQDSHSNFIKSLSDRGYDVTVKLANSRDLELKKYGEFLYDSLILFSPSVKKFGGDIDEDLILEFVDAGHSLVIAGSSGLKETVRSVAAHCGVSFSSEGRVAIDHFNYDASDSGLHTAIIAENFGSSAILGPKKHNPVLFQGVALSIDEENPLAVKLLKGSAFTYSANPAQSVAQRDLIAGSNVVLVAAVQTLGRGRVLVSGSLDLFSNNYWDASLQRFDVASGSFSKAGSSGNALFVEQVVGWTLHERGHLRLHSVTHRKADSSEILPRMYRVKDDVFFSVVIEEYDGRADKWVPYTAKDVQLEFVMLHPYVRTFLTPSENGTFSVEFKIPDVYGVFKFNIDYRRDGYSHVLLEHEIGVRPFRHNEFERFIPAAFPYYAAAFSMMGGFLLFSILFLCTQDKKRQ